MGGDGLGWLTAFRHVQDALIAAANPLTTDEIWVAAGTYLPDRTQSEPAGTGDPTASFFLQDGVSIYGGFAGGELDLTERDPALNETVLSGDYAAAAEAAGRCPPGATGDCFAPHATPGCDDVICCNAVCAVLPFCCANDWDGQCVAQAEVNAMCASAFTAAFHVVTADAVDLTARLDGFTITGGSAEGVDNNALGGGTLVVIASPAIVRCVFVANFAVDGGAMAMITDDPENPARPFVTNCRFLGNIAAADGGAIFNLGSEPRLTNCTFSGNHASGFGGAISNLGDDGGGQGAGLCAHPQVVNCTFSLNSAAILGGGLSNGANSTATVTNSILWDNAPDQIDDPNAAVSFSCIKGGFTGEGNIGSDPILDDPMFLDPAGMNGVVGDLDDDLRLALGSPCNDRAQSDLLPADVTDLDEDGDPGEPVPLDLALLPRVAINSTLQLPDLCAGVTVDMGAYENADCNSNGTRDENELTNNDTNGDGILDNCQDCNGNGTPDPVELALGGGVVDCNGNGILDECDTSPEFNCAEDCNPDNGTPDDCEFISGTNLREFEPLPFTDNGRGMAFDGEFLYYTIWPGSTEPDPNIYKVTTDGVHVEIITPFCPGGPGVVDGRQIGALAFASVGGLPTLWAATYEAVVPGIAPLIFRIDAQTGEVLETIDIGAVMNPDDPFPSAIDGLAYDPGDNSLFFSSDLGNEVFNIEANGNGQACTPVAAVQNPDRGFVFPGGAMSGHAFDGENLFVGQAGDINPPPQILRVATDELLISDSFEPIGMVPGSVAFKVEDIAFDDVTFEGKCVIWANEAVATLGGGPGVNRIVAFEVRCPCLDCFTCPPDLNLDCEVGIVDFLELLGSWGACPAPPMECPADVDGDGMVGITDFLALLGSWGPCPLMAGPPTRTIQQEVEAAGLQWPDDWDDFVDIMIDPDPDEAQQANWLCWMDHYLDCHTRPFCFDCACLICPDVDPFGGH